MARPLGGEGLEFRDDVSRIGCRHGITGGIVLEPAATFRDRIRVSSGKEAGEIAAA